MGHGCNSYSLGRWRRYTDTVNKWQPHVDLVQIPRELGMHHTMFNLNSHGPDDECCMTGMRDLLLRDASSATFGSLMPILAPYVRCPINDITTMVVSLGEVESWRQQKGVPTVWSPLCPSVKKHTHVGD